MANEMTAAEIITLLRERCERLRRLFMAADYFVGMAEASTSDYSSAWRDCKAHNDLTPPKETNDG